MGIDIQSGSVPTETTAPASKSVESHSQKQATALKTAQTRNQEVAKEENKNNSKQNNRQQIQEWVEKMNVTIDEKVKFSYSEDFGGIYVTVIDDKTQEVIRKIPTEDAIKLSKIWKEAIGNIFDSKG
jgi:flagellar protein FlaG